MSKEPIKIVITGGPSGGKTTLINAIQKELGPQCAVVPEAASILYKGGYPRSQNIISREHTQKAIYYTQRELEAQIIQESQKSLIVCDRGSLDATAYWPSSSSSTFFKAVGSDLESELKRYHWVLHLDTASPEFYDASNPLRTENYQEAEQLNSAIKLAWQAHPQKIIISQNSDFLSKIMTSLAVIKAISSHGSTQEILRLVKS